MIKRQNLLWWLALPGAALLAFSIGTTAERALLVLDGIVTERQEGMDTSSRNRHFTNYTLQSTTGETLRYQALGTDQSIRRDLPLGTHLIKQKWQLTYHLGDRQVSDFPIIFYSLTGLIGAVLLFVAPVQALLRSRKQHEPNVG